MTVNDISSSLLHPVPEARVREVSGHSVIDEKETERLAAPSAGHYQQMSSSMTIEYLLVSDSKLGTQFTSSTAAIAISHSHLLRIPSAPHSSSDSHLQPEGKQTLKFSFI